MDSLYPVLSVTLILGLLRLVVPNQAKQAVDEEKLAKNAKKYNRLEIASIIPMFTHIGLVAYLFYVLGQFFFANASSDEVIFYYPDPMIWTVVGMIFGFGTCAISMIGFLKFFLKEDYDNYLEFSSRKHGFDGKKLELPIYIILNTLGIVALVLALNTHLKITDQYIEVNPLFSLKSIETPLQEIGKIALYQKKKAPNGKVVDNEHYVVYKNDGTIILDESFKLFQVQPATFNYLLEQRGLDLSEKILRIDRD